MKKLCELYQVIKKIEDETLYEFKGYNEEEEAIIFVYENEFYTTNIEFYKDDMYISMPKGCNGVLIGNNELKLFNELLDIIREIEE